MFSVFLIMVTKLRTIFRLSGISLNHHVVGVDCFLRRSGDTLITQRLNVDYFIADKVKCNWC